MARYLGRKMTRREILQHVRRFSSGEYTRGIEPANCHMEGGAKERPKAALQVLELSAR